METLYNKSMGKSIQKIYYYLRLDDVSPNMDLEKWLKVEKILDKNNIIPVVAIIPNNEDKGQIFNQHISDYKLIIERWKLKGWIFAQHGYNHVYSKNKSGYFKYRAKKSEFAGHKYDIQLNKIEKGIKALDSLKIKSNIWVSPSGTFDRNTLKCLTKSGFKFLVDGISQWPYFKYGILWIPVQSNSLVQKEKDGLWGFCLHPNTMNDNDFIKLLDFTTKHKKRFNFDLLLNITNMTKNRSLHDIIWSLSRYLTFALRNFKLYKMLLKNIKND